MDQLAEAVGFGMVTAAVLALAAVGLTLQLGVTNFINFAYGDFMTFGAYVTLTANVLGVNFFLAVIIGGIVTALLALAANIVVFRPFVRRRSRVVTFLILTLGLSFIIQNAIIVIWGTGAERYDVTLGSAMNLGPFVLTPGDLIMIAMAAILLFGLHLMLQYTTFGKSLRATSNNRDLARACGIDTEMLTNWTWVISGFLAAVAGAGLVLQIYTLLPTSGFNELFFIFASIILGGIGRPYGAMLGAVIIGLVTEVSGMYMNAGYKAAFAFAILVLVLLLRPQGLFAARGRSE